LSSEIRVNLGDGRYEADDGSVWEADRAYARGAWGCLDMARTDVLTTGDGIAGTADAPLYQSMRVGEKFRYRFDVEAGYYLVRIHFAEIYWESADAEAQDVFLNGRRAIRNYNIYDEAGHDSAAWREFRVRVDEGPIEVRFEGRSLPMHSGARACALEVLATKGGE
jgi:hypothetical protein